MSSSLSIAPLSAEGQGAEGRPAPQPQLRRGEASHADSEAPPQADPGQRLVIEEMAEGGLIYTVIDRASGAVLARISRDEVAQMGCRPGYMAGALIRAKA